ncbi:MAG: hypothetical protein ABJB74_10900 [Gemmatimonas sp.]
MNQRHQFAPISRVRALMLVAPLVLCFTTPLGAQPIAIGTRVRVTSIDGAVKPGQGTFLRSSRDSIWLKEKTSDSTVAFPLQKARGVEQSTQYKPRFWRAAVGAGIGVAIAVGAGEVYLKSSGRNCDTCEPDIGAAIAIVVGAHLFGGIGAAVGASAGGEQWKPVKLPLTVSTIHVSRRQVQLGSISF